MSPRGAITPPLDRIVRGRRGDWSARGSRRLRRTSFPGMERRKRWPVEMADSAVTERGNYRAGGATEAPSMPCRVSERATKPDAFASSMNSRT